MKSRRRFVSDIDNFSCGNIVIWPVIGPLLVGETANEIIVKNAVSGKGERACIPSKAARTSGYRIGFVTMYTCKIKQNR